MTRHAVVGALFAVVLLVGCTSGGTSGTVDDGLDDPPMKVDTTEQGFDPADQIATAETIQDRIVDGGFPCDGEAAPPADKDLSLGVVAGVDCDVGDSLVQITVYRSADAKVAGVDEVEWFSCLEDKSLSYIDGGDWVLGALNRASGASDDALVERLSQVLEMPVSSTTC